MVDAIGPAVPGAGPARRNERPPAPPADAEAPSGDFSTGEAAVLMHLAQSDFVRNIARSILQKGASRAPAAPRPDGTIKQDLSSLGNDTRGGEVNVLA